MLASPSTLSRFDNAAGRKWAWSMHAAWVDHFIASHAAPPHKLVLASLAYTLLATLRRSGLRGSELAQAQCGTIRRKLPKIGAIIVRNTR